MEREREREREGGGGNKNNRKKKEKKSPTSFIKSLLGPPVPFWAESSFWPTMLNLEQRGYQKSDLEGTFIMLVA